MPFVVVGQDTRRRLFGQDGEGEAPRNAGARAAGFWAQLARHLRPAPRPRRNRARRFRLFESPAAIFPVDDCAWKFNERGSPGGFDKATGDRAFTRQPHGSQFTVVRPVPGSARAFSVDRTAPLVEQRHVLRPALDDPGWIPLDRSNT